MSKTKRRAKQNIDKNPIEQILGGFDQILGTSGSKEKRKKNQETELVEGQVINLKENQEEKSEMQEEKAYVEPAINYFKEVIHTGERLTSRENQEIEVQLRELMEEIKKIADSSKELQMQFREVAVEQYISKPGKYHKSFFSWLLSVIRSARMKVENSNAWLEAIHSKKKSREYGAMSKKYGTSFSLSNERNVSTQVG